ncbi:hypothetical protein FGD77_14535 [Roseovarius sp. M141]|nr:hypothetical protein [Roseovarius sp. M141]
MINSGHSLTDAYVNWGAFPSTFRSMWNEFYAGNPAWDNVEESTVPGSDTKHRWDKADWPAGADARRDIADYGQLVLAEGGPIARPGSIDEIYEYAKYLQDLRYESLFYENTITLGDGGAGAEMLLWTIWPEISGDNGGRGSFRDMLDEYEYSFHDRQEKIMAAHPGGPYLHIIPGHRLMMRIWDDMQSGVFPDGITDIQVLFDDLIHPNAIGNYACSLMVLSVTLAIDPRDVVHVPDMTIGGTNYATPAMVAYMKQIVWEIVTTYARAGMGGTDLGAIVDYSETLIETPRETLGDAVFHQAQRSDMAGLTGPITSAVLDGQTFNVSNPGEGSVVAENGGITFTDNGLYLAIPGATPTSMVYGIVALNAAWNPAGERGTKLLELTDGVSGDGVGIDNWNETGSPPMYRTFSSNASGNEIMVARAENIILEFYYGAGKTWIFGQSLSDPTVIGYQTSTITHTPKTINYISYGVPQKAQPWFSGRSNWTLYGAAFSRGTEPTWIERKVMRAWAKRQFPAV